MEAVPEIREQREKLAREQAEQTGLIGAEKTLVDEQAGYRKQQAELAQGLQTKLAGVPKVGPEAAYFKQSTPFSCCLPLWLQAVP
jgi:hypothetical protein